MLKLKALATASLIIIAIIATLYLRSHWISVGEARVQARWDAQVLQAQAAAATYQAEQIPKARHTESQRYQENERITDDFFKQGQKICPSLDAAHAANERLQQFLKSTSSPSAGGMSTPGTDACARTPANAQAARARQLLAECSAANAALAADADRLANQVIGLQQYAAMCAQSGSEDGGNQ